MSSWDFTLKNFYSREAELSFEHFSSFLIIHGSINILQPDRCYTLGHSRKIWASKRLGSGKKLKSKVANKNKTSSKPNSVSGSRSSSPKRNKSETKSKSKVSQKKPLQKAAWNSLEDPANAEMMTTKKVKRTKKKSTVSAS